LELWPKFSKTVDIGEEEGDGGKRQQRGCGVSKRSSLVITWAVKTDPRKDHLYYGKTKKSANARKPQEKRSKGRECREKEAGGKRMVRRKNRNREMKSD